MCLPLCCSVCFHSSVLYFLSGADLCGRRLMVYSRRLPDNRVPNSSRIPRCLVLCSSPSLPSLFFLADKSHSVDNGLPPSFPLSFIQIIKIHHACVCVSGCSHKHVLLICCQNLGGAFFHEIFSVLFTQFCCCA